MSRSKMYTHDQMIHAIQTHSSIAQTLASLGLRPCGGNYKTIHSFINENKVDISHFTGSAWCVGEKAKYLSDHNRSSMDDILSGACTYKSSHKLKLRLIKEGYFKHKCYCCNITDWMGEPVPIELEHINGDSSDNKLNNLTLLCPNCHAQTPTYRGKNKRKQ